MIKYILKSVFAASLLIFITTACQREQADIIAETRPNIIFIMADDLGYAELGSYGQDLIRTPKLDEMAREGMRFTSVYSGSQVCAPCRSVLMTGQHTGHTFVRNNKEIGTWDSSDSLVS